MTLSDMRCDTCGNKHVVSWSYTDGAKCHQHSQYVGDIPQLNNELGNQCAAQVYKKQNEVPSETIRLWMLEFIKKHDRISKRN